MMSSSACTVHHDTVHHGTVHSGLGQLVFGSGQPIWVKKTRGARLCVWADALLESDGECGHVRRPILMLFSPVASSRPPLHSGIVKTPFLQLSFLSKKSNTT